LNQSSATPQQQFDICGGCVPEDTFFKNIKFDFPTVLNFPGDILVSQFVFQKMHFEEN
jgi:hypothetical protein